MNKSKFKVLIAVNSSKVSEKAFEFYMDNFFREGQTEVIVSYEVPQPVFPQDAFSSASSFPTKAVSRIVEDCNKAKQEVESLYIAKCKKYKQLSYKVYAEISKEKPGPAIIARALSTKANLIVVGSEVLGSRGAPIASVSNFVLLHALVPVLIYRSK